MNEQNEFALVPRSSTAIEKAEPGAKRVLASMVADTLALAKSPAIRVLRVVILDDVAEYRNIHQHILRDAFPGLEILEFAEGDATWLELSREEPDLFITDVTHPGMKCDEMLAELAQRKVKYPVFVVSATLGRANMKVEADAWSAKAPNLNVSFVPKPFKVGEFVKAVEAVLQYRARSVQIAADRSKTRPLRIVHVDDEDFMFHLVSKFVREKYQDVIIETFQNGDKAWEDLSRADPDLLITDLLNTNIPGRTQQVARAEFGMSGYELLPLLAKKKVNYPILVLSGSLSRDGYEARAREYAGPILNISFLKKPFTSEQLFAELSKLLGSGDMP